MFYFYILPQVLWGENSDLSDFHKACKGSQKITEVHSVSSHHAPEIRSERFNMLWMGANLHYRDSQRTRSWEQYFHSNFIHAQLR